MGELRSSVFAPPYARELQAVLSGTEEERRREIVLSAPHRVLVLCVGGQDRSRKIADELMARGYEALYRGVNADSDVSNGLRAKDVEWADVIVCISESVAGRLLARFGYQANKPVRILKLTEGEHAAAIRAGGQAEKDVELEIQEGLDNLGFVPKDEE